MKQLRITVAENTYEVGVEWLNEGNGFTTSRPSTLVGAPVNTRAQTCVLPTPPANPSPSAPTGAGAVVSPLAAVVVSVDVAVGDQIEAEQNVATLEAMKMNTLVKAPASGVVQSIEVQSGAAVEEGQCLLTIA